MQKQSIDPKGHRNRCNRQTDRQTDRQTHRQTDRQTDRQEDRQTMQRDRGGGFAQNNLGVLQ